MELTKIHIKELYKFTRKHFVYHYDVQTELVDHLANDIEDIFKENPKLSFEEAKRKSFKKFGIFGFMEVIEAKQKQMNKRYWKIIMRFTKEWFTLPKAITTSLMFLGFFFILQIQYSEYAIMASLLVLIVFEMISTYKIRKLQKEKEKKKEEKIFLLEAIIGDAKNGTTGFAFINLFNVFNMFNFNFSALNIYWIAFISAALTLLCILFYVTNYVIPQKTEELLIETYPEYKIVNNL